MLEAKQMTQKSLRDFSFAFEDFVCVAVEATMTTFLIKFSSNRSKDVVCKVLQYKLLYYLDSNRFGRILCW